MPELTDEIDRLLRESIQAHEAARTARQSRGVNAKALLERARDLRHEALGLDPDRKATAWAAEVARLGRDVHPALLAFYDAQAPR